MFARLNFIAFALISSFCLAAKTDSLHIALEKSQHDSSTASTLYNLSREYQTQKNYTRALGFAEKGLAISLRISKTKGLEQHGAALMGEGFYLIGTCFKNQNENNQAFKYYNYSLTKYSELDLDNASFKIIRDYSGVYNNRGLIYKNLGDYRMGLENYFKCLELRQKINDETGIGFCYNNIGNIYYFLNEIDKALGFFYKSLAVAEKNGDKRAMSQTYNNLGNAYYTKPDYFRTLSFYDKSLKLKKELGHTSGIISTSCNMGSIFIQLIDLPEDSLKCHFSSYKTLDSITIRKSLLDSSWKYQQLAKGLAREEGDEFYMIYIHRGFGDVYFKRSQWKQALSEYTKAIDIGERLEAKRELYEIYDAMANVCSKLGMFKQAFDYQKEFMALKDTVFKDDKQKELGKLEAEYDYNKKLLETEKEHEKDQALNVAAHQKQKLISWSVAGGLLMALMFSGVLFNRVRVIRKKNQIIEQQKITVEEKNKNITDSINYAKKIQEAILPFNERLARQLNDHFILHRPKDIVSGDLYWVNQQTINNVADTIIAVVDCTGHGVPGAFMSMIANDLLNDIVVAKGIRQPDLILKQLNIGIKYVLKQDETGSRDGMDLSLVRYYPENGKYRLIYSGANCPLWIKRIESNEIQEIKATKSPIGGHADPAQNFDLHELELSKGDSFYLFTDGFADQFGGPQGKKLKYKPLKELIVTTSAESISAQGEHLLKWFDQWKTNYEQTDDVTMIGIRV